jgi:catechol 2,3-dioxygenase-like lactoylglutathione lyase family enzyme
MKLRVGEPWMRSKDYGRSLKALSVNLLVRDIDAAVAFGRQVLGANLVYADPDFAVLGACDAEWMLHADHTYDKHPMGRTVEGVPVRGTGVELRLHGCDPDAAEAAARRLGFRVLSPATDKGHGLREVYLQDGDGYIWVPDVPTKDEG